jgi:hypothetical protein
MTQPASTPEPVSPRHVTVTAVHWRNVLEFTQLFRSFRLAMNPAKILMALLALLLIYSAGRLFDLAWGPQVYSDEIISYQTELPKNYNRLRDQRISGRATNLYMLLRQIDDPALPLEDIERLKNSPRPAYRTLKDYYQRQFQATLKNLGQQRELQEKEIASSSFVTRDSQTPVQIEQEERGREARRLKSRIDAAKVVAGAGIFASFMDFEIAQFDALVENTLSFVRILPARPPRLDISIPGMALAAGIVSREPDSIWRSDTIAGTLANMTITGPTWLVSATAPMQWRPLAGGDAAGKPLTWGGRSKMIAYRGVYVLSLLVLLLFAIIVLALTGATISRLSALELAGIERASLTEVFLFSYRRLWVFIKAPITPFLILLVVGLFITAISLLGAIPYAGEIILGILFIGLLVVGFVLMLLVLGVLGGLNLLFPTIAVEGSDAFDVARVCLRVRPALAPALLYAHFPYLRRDYLLVCVLRRVSGSLDHAHFLRLGRELLRPRLRPLLGHSQARDALANAAIRQTHRTDELVRHELVGIYRRAVSAFLGVPFRHGDRCVRDQLLLLESHDHLSSASPLRRRPGHYGSVPRRVPSACCRARASGFGPSCDVKVHTRHVYALGWRRSYFGRSRFPCMVAPRLFL